MLDEDTVPHMSLRAKERYLVVEAKERNEDLFENERLTCLAEPFNGVHSPLWIPSLVLALYSLLVKPRQGLMYEHAHVRPMI